MKNNLTTRTKNVTSTFNADDVLKITSLIYLKEALKTQRYEECSGLIRDAKSFGAKQSEINAVLAGYNKADWDIKANSRF